MLLNKGVYYNRVRDDLLLITKSETLNFYNKETKELTQDSLINLYYSNDLGDIVRIKKVTITGKEHLIYLGEY